jgi:hypothetical protein
LIFGGLKRQDRGVLERFMLGLKKEERRKELGREAGMSPFLIFLTTADSQ